MVHSSVRKVKIKDFNSTFSYLVEALRRDTLRLLIFIEIGKRKFLGPVSGEDKE
jgi:hypothetical protein